LENKNLSDEALVKEKHKKAKSDAAITSKKIGIFFLFKFFFYSIVYVE
jgi:hypothetical protein